MSEAPISFNALTRAATRLLVRAGEAVDCPCCGEPAEECRCRFAETPYCASCEHCQSHCTCSAPLPPYLGIVRIRRRPRDTEREHFVRAHAMHAARLMRAETGTRRYPPPGYVGGYSYPVDRLVTLYGGSTAVVPFATYSGPEGDWKMGWGASGPVGPWLQDREALAALERMFEPMRERVRAVIEEYGGRE